MPLIILSGYPCSGLTYRAHQLHSALDAIQSASAAQDTDKPRPYKIHVVSSHDNDGGAHPRTVYDTARLEKEARAVVYGRVKRLLGRDSIVIIDGMNYIKGWRYQLWCEAKGAGTTCCVVHVGTPVEQCIANNEARLKRKAREQSSGSAAQTESSEPSGLQTGQTAEQTNDNDGDGDSEDPYPSELLSNLIFRHEEPSTSGRWDKPLFTVPWPDPTPPTDEIWSAITGAPRQPTPSASAISNLINAPLSSSEAATTPTITTATTSSTTSPAAEGTFTRRARPKIVPHQATQRPRTTDPNSLYSLERRTSEIIAAIRAFTLANPIASTATTTSISVNNNDANPSTTTDADADADTADTALTIPLPHSTTPLHISASTLSSAPTDELAGAGGILALPRLQRLRRQWIGLNRAVVTGRGGAGGGSVEPEQVGDAFARFLNAEIEGVDVRAVRGDG